MRKLVLFVTCFMVLAFAGVGMSQNSNNQMSHSQNNSGHGMMNQGMMGPGMRGGMMGPGMMNGNGYGYGYGCWMPGAPGFQAYQKFLQDNRKTIEALNAKRAALMAIYASSKPNPQKAAKLAREITKLEEKLQKSAFNYNLPDPCPWMWRGGGMMMRGNW